MLFSDLCFPHAGSCFVRLSICCTVPWGRAPKQLQWLRFLITMIQPLNTHSFFAMKTQRMKHCNQEAHPPSEEVCGRSPQVQRFGDATPKVQKVCRARPPKVQRVCGGPAPQEYKRVWVIKLLYTMYMMFYRIIQNR